MTAAAPNAPAPLPRRWLVLFLSGAVLVLAAVLVGGLGVAHGLRGAFGGPVLDTPGAVSQRVPAGRLLVYAESGETSSGPGISFSRTYPSRLDLADLEVTEDGRPITVTAYEGTATQTITRGSTRFAAVGQLDVPSAGTLVVSSTADDGRLVVGPDLGRAFRRIVAPLAVAGSLGLVGVVLAVVGLVTRHRAAERLRPPYLAAGRTAGSFPGWAPPPYPPPGWAPPPAYPSPPEPPRPGSPPPG